MSGRGAWRGVLALVAIVVAVLLALRRAETSSERAVEAPHAPAPATDVPDEELLESAEAAPESKDREPVPAAPAPASEAADPTCRVQLVVVQAGTEQVIAGASVRPRTENGFSHLLEELFEEPLRTDAAGGLAFVVPMGETIYVDVRGSDGPQPDPETELGETRVEVEPLSPGETRELRVDLPWGLDAETWGRVVEEPGERPIAGAEVSVVSPTYRLPGVDLTPAEPRPVRALSDAAGLFRLRFASWKDELLVVRAAGFEPAVAEIDFAHPKTSRAQKILLQAGARLLVRVRGEDARLRDAAIVVESDLDRITRPAEDVWRGDLVRWSVPLESGVCTLTELPPRVPLSLRVVRGDQTLASLGDPLQLEPGEQRELELSLGAVSGVEGRLVDEEGLALPGLEVWLKAAPPALDAADAVPRYFGGGERAGSDGRAKTDSAGRFRFDALPAGVWWVGLAPREDLDGQAVASLAQVVVTRAQGETVATDLVAGRELYVAGTVLGPDGEPYEGAFVSAETEDGWPSWQADASDEEGGFRIGPLAPGRHRIAASPPASALSSEALVVSSGTSGHVLRLPLGSSLSVQLVAPEPWAERLQQAGSMVYLLDEDSRMVTGLGHGGTFFELTGVLPGEYSIRVEPEDTWGHSSFGWIGLATGVSVEELGTSQTVEVELVQAATLRVRYEGDEPSAKYRVLQGGRLVAERTAERGVSVPVWVFPGSGTIELLREGAVLDAVDFEVAAGAECEQVLGRAP